MKLDQPARSANNPPGERIEVRVTDLKQLFDSMDPSPFRERDLDPHAEEFIVSWAREAPRGASLTLIVHADQARGKQFRGCGGRHEESDLAHRRSVKPYRGLWAAVE